MIQLAAYIRWNTEKEKYLQTAFLKKSLINFIRILVNTMSHKQSLLIEVFVKYFLGNRCKRFRSRMLSLLSPIMVLKLVKSTELC